MPDSPSARRRPSDPRFPVRARHLLPNRSIWIIPLVVASLVVAVMAAFYVSSVVNPLAHLRGLPVAFVNQDQGASVGPERLEIGGQVQHGLLTSPQVNSRLHFVVENLPQAEAAMSRDSLYAALVIPPDFTASLLSVSGLTPSGAARPQIQVLTNPRAGTVGTQLAVGVLQPALAAASVQIGKQLTLVVPTQSQTGATKALLADPVAVATNPYRPLPAPTALGLSAFYVALLILMCGFLAGTTVNSGVDSALGYASTDIGPRWRQRQPVPINRFQTLLMKWAMVGGVTAVLTGVVLIVAAGLFGMDLSHPGLLWVYAWLCAASVGAGTIVLFAVAGTFGQLVALLVFVYAGLASSGGTVPVQALPGSLRVLSNIEPLHQVLAGTRSIMYFNAQADAGLARGALAAGLGLLFWLAAGTLVVRFYDRRGFYRLHPDAMSRVATAIEDRDGDGVDSPAQRDAASAPSVAVPSGAGALADSLLTQ